MAATRTTFIIIGLFLAREGRAVTLKVFNLKDVLGRLLLTPAWIQSIRRYTFSE